MWVPGIATLVCVPFQFLAYMSPSLAVTLPSFVGLMLMAAVFFGPSFAMTQALATLRMRSVATSVLLFIQTLIGNGVGTVDDGIHQRSTRARFPDRLAALCARCDWSCQSLAAIHYMVGARSLRSDLELSEKLASA